MPDWIIKYWAEWLFGLIAGALALGYRSLSRKIKADRQEREDVKDGLLAILHDRVYDESQHCLRQGYIEPDRLRNITYLYDAYHKLGGNGTGTELYSRAKSLPIREYVEERNESHEN